MFLSISSIADNPAIAENGTLTSGASNSTGETQKTSTSQTPTKEQKSPGSTSGASVADFTDYEIISEIRSDGWSKPYLTYADPQTIEAYRASLPKPTFKQKFRLFYQQLFNSIDNRPIQGPQLAPLLFTNSNQSPTASDREFLTDIRLNSNQSFIVKNGAGESFNNKIVGLVNDQQLATFDESNIYSALGINISNALSEINDNTADGSLRHQFKTRALVTSALEGYGFYNAEVSVVATSDKEFIIYINPGRYVVNNNDSKIIIRGMGTGFSAYQRVDLQNPPFISSPTTQINFPKYEAAKSALSSISEDYGYFDAKFEKSQLRVDPEAGTAQWDLDYNTGDRYRISNIHLSSSHIREDIVKAALGIHPGEYYSAGGVSDSVVNLYRSKWFDAVQVDNSINKEAKVINLAYRLIPSKPNSLDVSLGFDSDEGFRTNATYERRYLNQLGDSLSSTLYLSKYTQSIESIYTHHLAENPLDKQLNLFLSLNREYQYSQKNYTRSIELGANYLQTPVNNWHLSLGINWRKDLWYELDKSVNSNLSYYSMTLSRGSLYTNVKLEFESNFILGKLLKDTVKYSMWSVGADHTFRFGEEGLKFRFKFAKLITDDFLGLTPSMRLYAGGASSVRGYALNSISEHTDKKLGKLQGYGGTHLNEFSLEYIHHITDSFKTAVFVDAGQVSDNWRYNNLQYGAGVGVRYYLPVGFANFDIAYSLKPKFSWSKIFLYFGITTQF